MPRLLQWKRASIGTSAKRLWRPRSCASAWVPERPVPPMKTSSRPSAGPGAGSRHAGWRS